MTTAIATRRPQGINRKPKEKQHSSKLIGASLSLPEYLEQEEVQALIRCAATPQSRLLMLVMWRAGLRVSEALNLERRDLNIDADLPNIRVRQGKGHRDRIVPCHPELVAGLSNALSYGSVGSGRIIDVDRSTAWRWTQSAYSRAVAQGSLPAGKKLHPHTLRHSYARHLLLNGIPLNYLSRWLGHKSISTTLIYLELIPDPSGSLSSIP